MNDNANEYIATLETFDVATLDAYYRKYECFIDSNFIESWFSLTTEQKYVTLINLIIHEKDISNKARFKAIKIHQKMFPKPCKRS